MTELMITGCRPRSGVSKIKISGAKNASLPLMAACLLTEEDVTLKKIPNISDVDLMKKQLESYGVKVSGNNSSLILNSKKASFSPANDAGRKTRGAFLVLGPVLSRLGEAEVYLPGGCQISQDGRPVDFHIDALIKMGANVVQGSSDCVTLTAPNGLSGAQIEFPKVSVGATENIVMAACLADGKTVITNAAVEPEVIDLVDMLREMGATIEVDEEGKMITAFGRQDKRLSGTTHTVIPDRIEAGTYAIAAAITGGPLLLKVDPSKARKILVPVIEKLKEAGVEVSKECNGLLIRRSGPIQPVDITTGPYPEFPTDLLPQWVTLMTQANGKSRIEDTIYNNRFKHVADLKKMGADVKVYENICVVNNDWNPRQGSRRKLTGKHVKATDLRAGMALILAALAAEKTTVIEEIDHVYRGYENLKEKLKECGAIVQELPKTRPGHYGYHA